MISNTLKTTKTPKTSKTTKTTKTSKTTKGSKGSKGSKGLRVSEHLEQSRFFAVLKRLEPTYPGLRGAFAIPNGFLDTKAKRIRATQEGVLSGVPDVFIPWPLKGFHGLFLEFKRPGGRVTKGQEEYLNLMASRGYKAQVVFGLREALEALKEYMSNA
jgi:hypothetical protein